VRRLTGHAIFESERSSQHLVDKSVRGGMTTMTSQGIQFVLSLVGVTILARLLTPADFGLVGMVTVIIGFARMFKDAGLSTATVQRERIRREQISTLFWLNVLLSLAIGLCIIAVSPLVAWFYGRPELTAVTATLSLSFMLTGLTIQHSALLRRQMRFGTLAVIQIASYVVQLIVTVLLALAGWRYWALVGGSLANAVSGTLLTFSFFAWMPGLPERGAGVRSMLKFGGHVTGFSFVNYFARNADNILIGRFLGADALGLYAKAYGLFMMPIQQIRQPLCHAALPVLSSLQNEPERYLKYYQRLIDILATLTFPLTIYCAIEADFLIGTLLGEQWLAAIPVFRILCIAALIAPIAGTRGLVLTSCGFSGRYFYWGLFNAILIVMAFIVGLAFGIQGVAAAYAVAVYVILIPSLFYCFHKTPVRVSVFLRTLAPPMLVGMVAGGCTLLLKYGVAGDSLLSHVLYAGTFVLVYGGLSSRRSAIRETWRLCMKNLPVGSLVGVARV